MNPTGKQDVTESQLASLKVLSRQLERDVKTLQSGKASLDSCVAKSGGLADAAVQGSATVTWVPRQQVGLVSSITVELAFNRGGSRTLYDLGFVYGGRRFEPLMKGSGNSTKHSLVLQEG
jgi:hypothetical protein